MGSRIEKRVALQAPVARVWRALTDYREFGQWFRVKLDGPFVPGQVLRGHITYPGYEHLRWEAVVEKMEPERLFSFTWHPYAVAKKTIQRKRQHSSNSDWRRPQPERCFGSPSPASTKSPVSAAWKHFA